MQNNLILRSYSCKKACHLIIKCMDKFFSAIKVPSIHCVNGLYVTKSGVYRVGCLSDIVKFSTFYAHKYIIVFKWFVH